MRLIDADALKENFDLYTDRKGYLKADPEDLIDNAPTIDITETIGKFRNTAYQNGLTTGLHKGHNSFCPNCGAEVIKNER